tara:strand:+ start:3590 stop:4303 length:714 start_codon:yes stop_codon:yes gene_type:complete
LAETEIDSNQETETAVNVVKLVEDQNSYINSSKERMNDVITTFVNNAENSIALNDFSQIFKTVTVWIKFRPRKLGQYVEIMKERTTDTTVSIRYSADEYIPHIKEILKEHKLKMISNENNVMVCKTPRPSDQDIEIAVQKVKVMANTARSSISQGKAAEIQRLQSALKNEYLEAKDVKYAISAIEKIEEKFAAVLTYSRLEAEKKISGKLFRYDSNEAKDIHQALMRRVKKNSFIEI